MIVDDILKKTSICIMNPYGHINAMVALMHTSYFSLKKSIDTVSRTTPCPKHYHPRFLEQRCLPTKY